MPRRPTRRGGAAAAGRSAAVESRRSGTTGLCRGTGPPGASFRSREGGAAHRRPRTRVESRPRSCTSTICSQSATTAPRPRCSTYSPRPRHHASAWNAVSCTRCRMIDVDVDRANDHLREALRRVPARAADPLDHRRRPRRSQAADVLHARCRSRVVCRGVDRRVAPNSWRRYAPQTPPATRRTAQRSRGRRSCAT